MIRGNCRSILGVLVGVMNPQGLLGYLRFCKLCKSYSTLLLCLFTYAFSLWWCNARCILNQQTRCPLLMLCLCLLRLVTKYFIIVSGLLEYKWTGYESDLRSNEHYLSSSENKAWKKFRPVQDLNPWPLRYQCSALPTVQEPAPNWLVSSVGRALHRYRRGHGFKSGTGLNFFRPSFHCCLSSVHNYEDRFHIHVFIRSSNIWLSYILSQYKWSM